MELIGGKTNQLNAPNFRIITKTGGLLCPYSFTKRHYRLILLLNITNVFANLKYLEKLGGHKGSLQPACSPINPQKPSPSRSVSYTVALSNMRNLLELIGYNGDDYSEHSPRRGMATEGASSGMTESEIQISGGWQDQRSMRLYIDRKPQQFQNIAKKFFK